MYICKLYEDFNRNHRYWLNWQISISRWSRFSLLDVYWASNNFRSIRKYSCLLIVKNTICTQFKRLTMINWQDYLKENIWFWVFALIQHHVRTHCIHILYMKRKELQVSFLLLLTFFCWASFTYILFLWFVLLLILINWIFINQLSIVR